MTPGALHGLVVIDLTRMLAGPLCTQMLADHGADVIKVEPPNGDETRALGPPFDSSGDAAYYAALNRGKRAISLDLGMPEGRMLLDKLLARADIFVENFLPKTLERWGLYYEGGLAEKFPRLIYCSISGFGADGPLGGLPGYDAVLQAMCGLMSVNGDPKSGPTRVGIPLVDHLTGYVALCGILMALRVRERTGRGQRVEAALFDTALSLLIPQAANWLASGNTPSLLGSAHPNIAPYDTFRVRDGTVFLGVVSDAQFRRFCVHIGRPTLSDDPRYASNSHRIEHRVALRREIEEALQSTSAAALCEALMRAGVPAGVVNSVPEAFAQPHVEHRQLLVRSGDYTGIRSPVLLRDTPSTPGGKPPSFSQHSAEVLKEFGLSDADVARFQQSGVVAGNRKSASKPSTAADG